MPSLDGGTEITMTNQKKVIYTVIAAVLGLLIIGAAYYIALPPINVYAIEFWVFLMVSIAIIGVPIAFIFSWDSFVRASGRGRKLKVVNVKFSKLTKNILATLICLPIAVILFGSLLSSEFLNATDYAQIIEVENRTFETDMPESTSITNIALMDTPSAIEIGGRVLSSSQYEFSQHYTQINYKGAPKKVSNLEYTGFFKWINNRDTGLPGFVMVDPVNSSAEYVLLKNPMKYVDSAYFGDDLMRRLRFDYPTKIFDEVYFEIDEEGDPWFIVSCLKPKIGLFGGYDVNEVILFNPCDGSSEIFDVSETPSWIDIVYTGDLACQKYNWLGLYHDGFWNSVIGKIDCRQTTDDFGYITLGDDVWYFTGVTSLSNDASNIGFILSNARTGEYKFYPVIGAEEHSAMGSAEGEVQEKGYTASFPSLVNIEGEPTYIMVLKDDNRIVRLYALVNVENYSIVATGETQKDVMDAYRQKLITNGIIEGGSISDESTEEHTVAVADVRLAQLGGESVVYITALDGKVYKGYLGVDEGLILVRVGDVLKIKCTESDIKELYNIVSWSK